MNTLGPSQEPGTPRSPEAPGARPSPRLLTRTLTVTFVTVGLILCTIFLVLTLDLRRRARNEVADRLDDSRVTVSVFDAHRFQEFGTLGASLSEDPTFASALQKFRNQMGSFSRAEVQLSRSWLEGRLDEMAEVLRADAAAVVDSHGLTVAVAGQLGPEWPANPGTRVELSQGKNPRSDDFLLINGNWWRVFTIALDVRGQVATTLCVADRIDQRYASSLSMLTRAETVVTSPQGVVATTRDERWAKAVAAAWRGGERGEIDVLGERYAFRRLLGDDATAAYGLAALGARMSKSTASAYRALSLVAIGSLVLAWFGSVVLAHRLSAPIDQISRSLAAAAGSRTVRVELPRSASSRELDAVTDAFNHLMASLERSEKETQAAYVGAIRALAAALDARDPYTAGHSERVSELAVEIAQQMRLPHASVEVVRLGALLHDIGKIGVDDAVLNKPGSLTAAERAAIEAHPVLGARILEPVAFLAPHLPVVELHHERPDGEGYPHGLVGDAIPPEARIVHVADAFDAMTSTRPYRPARTLERAVDELLRHRGTQFDAAVVDALVNLVSQRNPVCLDDEEPGVGQVA